MEESSEKEFKKLMETEQEERLVVVCQPSLNVFQNRMAVVLALPPKVRLSCNLPLRLQIRG
jgi:hypothetical protein